MEMSFNDKCTLDKIRKTVRNLGDDERNLLSHFTLDAEETRLFHKEMGWEGVPFPAGHRHPISVDDVFFYIELA